MSKKLQTGLDNFLPNGLPHPKGWIQTNSGQCFDLLNPTISMITTSDIAEALFKIPRFNGHLSTWWSVLHHSLAVAKLVQNILSHDETYSNWTEETKASTILCALLHDATEAYVGDMAKPLKDLLPEYRTIEDRIFETIRVAYSLPPICPLIKLADAVLLSTEASHFLSPPPVSDWHLTFAPPLPYSFLEQFEDAEPHTFILEVEKWYLKFNQI